jgi:hypothetical protein
VIRSWQASDQPDADGNLITIVGRQEGFVGWLLTKMGIDVTTRLRISQSTIYFERGSLEGFTQRVIPIGSLSSAFFGYVKPWREAVALTIILAPIVIGFIFGPLYYFLNKKLSIGVFEVSGIGSGIEFKRSIIEGRNIDEAEGQRVIAIIHDLVVNGGVRPMRARG